MTGNRLETHPNEMAKICFACGPGPKSGAMKSTGRKTVKVDRTSAPLRKTSKTKAAEMATTSETSATAATATMRKPTHEEIAQRSYEIFLARGGFQGIGSPEQDWLQAERELSLA